VIASLRRLARDRYRLAILLRKGTALSELDRQFVRLVLAAEDKRYWLHSGVDWIAAARAFFRYAAGRPKGGASTIEMQLVRTVTHRRERTARRKIREMVLASDVGCLASKRTILTTYLSIAYFGHDLVGVEAAALAVFRTHVDDTCSSRHAFLAALLVCPLPRSRTLDWYRRAFRRARWILSRIDLVPN
jgi:membrane peptidoglycan carboxypeptidase